jgi:hypothetical protein
MAGRGAGGRPGAGGWISRPSDWRAVAASVVVAAMAFAGGYVAFQFATEHPRAWWWLPFWVVVLLTAALVLSLGVVQRALGIGSRGAAIAALIVSLFSTLHLFHVELKRQNPEHIVVQGVFVGGAMRPYRLGTGPFDLDVRLASSSDDLDDWSLTLHAEKNRLTGRRHLVVDSARGIDLLSTRGPSSPRAWGDLLRGRWPGRRWRPIWGATLARSHGSVLARSARGDTTRIRFIAGAGRRGAIAVRGGTALLSSDDAVADSVLRDQLRLGAPLSALAWDSLPPAELAEDLVVTLVGDERSVMGLPAREPVYRVVSRAGSVEGERADSIATSSGPPAHPVLVAGDTVQVVARGKRWRFAPSVEPAESAGVPMLHVRFVSRPAPLSAALPAAEQLRGAAAGLFLSTRALPPPQPHIDLSGFGLDSVRFDLTARLQSRDGGFSLVTARRQIPLADNAISHVRATSVLPGSESGGFLVGVRAAGTGQFGEVLRTLILLAFVMIGAITILAARDGDRPAISVNGRGGTGAMDRAVILATDRRLGWRLLHLCIAFLAIRLALGFRVAYAAPSLRRAAETAIGMWCVFAALLVILGRWDAWERWLADARAFVGSLRRGAFADAIRPLESRRFSLPELRYWPHACMVLAAVLLVLQHGWLLAFNMGAALVMIMGAWLLVDGTRAPSLGVVKSRGVLDVLAPAIPGGPGAAAAEQRAVWSISWLACLLGLSLIALHRVASAIIIVVVGVVLVDLLATGAWRLVGKRSAPSVSGWIRRLWARVFAVRIAAVVALPVLLVGVELASGVNVGPTLAFAEVFFLFLLAVRAGVMYMRRRMAGTAAMGWRRWIFPLYPFLFPLLILVALTLRDFGLGLVFFYPLFVTVLLAMAARLTRLEAVWAGALLAIVVVGADAVLFSAVREVREGGRGQIRSATELSADFLHLGNPVVDALRAVPASAGPVTRSIVRGLASLEPDALEHALTYLEPGVTLDQLRPSLEQAWGARAYAAVDGRGTGFAGPMAFDRGIAQTVAYAENTFAVFVLAENGALGGGAVLLAYLMLLVVVGWWAIATRDAEPTPRRHALRAIVIGGVCWLVMPAAYVAAANLNLVPLTGQNMPFLGLNSWSDVVISCAIASTVVAGLLSSRAGDLE